MFICLGRWSASVFDANLGSAASYFLSPNHELRLCAFIGEPPGTDNASYFKAFQASVSALNRLNKWKTWAATYTTLMPNDNTHINKVLKRLLSPSLLPAGVTKPVAQTL